MPHIGTHIQQTLDVRIELLDQGMLLWVLLIRSVRVLVFVLRGIGKELSRNLEAGLRIVMIGLLHMFKPSMNMWRFRPREVYCHPCLLLLRARVKVLRREPLLFYERIFRLHDL